MRKIGKYNLSLLYGLLFLGIAIVAGGIGALLIIIYNGRIGAGLELLIRLLLYSFVLFFFLGLITFISSFLSTRIYTVYIDNKRIKKLGAIKTKNSVSRLDETKAEFQKRLIAQKFLKVEDLKETYYRGREIVIISDLEDLSEPYSLKYKLENISVKLFKEKQTNLTGSFRIANILFVENAQDDIILKITDKNNYDKADLGTTDALVSFCVYDVSENNIYFQYMARNRNKQQQQQQSLLLSLIFIAADHKSWVQKSNEKAALRKSSKDINIPFKEMYKLKSYDRVFYILSVFGFLWLLLIYGIVWAGLLSEQTAFSEILPGLIVFGVIFFLPSLICLFLSLRFYKRIIITEKGLSYKKLFYKKTFIPFSELKYSAHHLKMKSGNYGLVFALYSHYPMKEDEICFKEIRDYILIDGSKYNKIILERLGLQKDKF